MKISSVDVRGSNFGLRNNPATSNDPMMWKLHRRDEVIYDNGMITIQGYLERFLSVEFVTSASNQTVQKDVGNTIARGIIGGVALGPIGAVAGLLLGKNKLEGHQEFLFKVNLADGKYFIISEPSPTSQFQSLSPVSLNNQNNMEVGISPKTTQNESDLEHIEKMGLIGSRITPEKYPLVVRKSFIHNDTLFAVKYTIKYLNEVIIPIYSKNKLKAFVALKHENTYIAPYLHKAKNSCQNTTFVDEYRKYMNEAAAKKKFVALKKNIEKLPVTKKTLDDICIIALVYMTGKISVVIDKYEDSNSSEEFVVCDVDTNTARLMLNKAMASAENTLASKQQHAFMDRCKKLVSQCENYTEKTIPTDQKPSIKNLEIASLQPHSSVADEIKKLADLKIAGVLTDEEFQSQKTKLLNI